MAKERGTVRAKGPLFTDPVFVGSGYVMPRTFDFEANLEGGLTIRGEVEIEEERAVARRITIEAVDGVSSTTLRKVPVRDLVATACLNVLERAVPEPSEQGGEGFQGFRFQLIPIDESDAGPVRALIQDLVGYNPATDRPEVRQPAGKLTVSREGQGS